MVEVFPDNAEKLKDLNNFLSSSGFFSLSKFLLKKLNIALSIANFSLNNYFLSSNDNSSLLLEIKLVRRVASFKALDISCFPSQSSGISTISLYTF